MTYKGRLKDWETMSKEERKEALEKMEFLNADGEAVGYLVGEYLVGEVIDACDEYITLEWWMPVGVYEATEEPVTTYSNGKWYNPTSQEKADEWHRRTHKRRDMMQRSQKQKTEKWETNNEH